MRVKSVCIQVNTACFVEAYMTQLVQTHMNALGVFPEVQGGAILWYNSFV